MMEGLDETFDAVLFIGHHAKAGSPDGVFAHTQNGNIRDVQINGRSVGEGGISTIYAAWFGVPVVLVTGDQIAVAQITDVATDAKSVVVKRALAEYLAKEPVSAYEAGKDLFGRHGGGADLSARRRERYAEIVDAKRRRRR